MNAKYFYERLVGYPEEYTRTGKYYYGYENQNVTIHHKNNNDEWYIIHVDGSVTKEDKNGLWLSNFCKVDELSGDDFELFNRAQIFKYGYLVFDETDKTVKDMKIIISNLYGYIDSAFDVYPLFLSEEQKNIPRINGGSCWKKGLTDHFSYLDANNIELHIRTVGQLREANTNRVFYDAKPIPFIKSMDKRSSIHVIFDDILYRNNEITSENIYIRCNYSLKNLFTYLNAIGIKCKWVDGNLKHPVYL